MQLTLETTTRKRYNRRMKAGLFSQLFVAGCCFREPLFHDTTLQGRFFSLQ